MLTSHVSKAVFQGNGAATQFPFTFKVWEASHLAIEVVDEDGVGQDLSPWTVELTDTGGILHYTHKGGPLPQGYILVLLRNMPFTQEINLVTGTRFDPAVIEAQLDKATAERQQLREELERSVKVPATAAYAADDLLNEIMDAYAQSKTSAAEALQSELNAKSSINVAEILQQSAADEADRAQTEADRAKSEADRAVIEASTVVDTVTVHRNEANELSVVTYSLQDFALSPTEAEQKYPASIGAVANATSLPIGTQIAVRCSASYVPQGCIAEDGAEYSKVQFPDLWDNYLSTGLLHTCTYAEAAAQIAASGACNAFAIDAAKGTFKAPYTPNGYVVQQAMTDIAIGKSYLAGLPNITGTSFGVRPLSSNSTFSGALYSDSGSTTIGSSHNTSSGVSGFIKLNASRSNPIYGRSTTVQPRAITLRYFVVVATGSINQNMMDWNAWATSLQGKADKTELATKAPKPQYASGVGQFIGVWTSNQDSYTVPSGGTWFCVVHNYVDGGDISSGYANIGVFAGGTVFTARYIGLSGWIWRIA